MTHEAGQDGDDPIASGAAGLGQSCGGSVGCQYNLYCVPDGFNSGRCRRLCDPKANPSVCSSPETCNTIPAGFSPSEVLGICYEKSDWNKDCDDDAGCGPGFACAITADPTEWEGYGTRCQYSPANATKGPNGACAADDECKSGFCMSDAQRKGMYCYGACNDDADCPNGFCDDYLFTVDNQGNTASIPGCHISCNSNTVCKDYGSAVCFAFTTGFGSTARIRGECRQPFGAGAIGAACTSANACASGRCETLDGRGLPQAGFCNTLCDVDADCAGGLSCPSSGVAVRTSNGTDGVPGTADDAFLNARLCAGAACTGDADCTAAGFGACRLDVHPTTPKSSLVLRCGRPAGTVAGGAPCARDADCTSGLCFDPGSGTKICFAPCDAGASSPACASGLTCTAGIAEARALD
ncbi:MAG: hypothetical protein ACK4N5_22500, partial [Myxococcales bacterium]